MKKILKKIIIVLGIFVIGIVASIFSEHYFFPRLNATSFFSKISWLKKTTENVTIINKTEQITVKEEDSIDSVVSRVIPAVVNIISSPSSLSNTFLINTPIQSLSGTGVIVTADGLVVTHKKAISLESSHYVILTYDGSKYEAELVGYDEFTDLAYLKINSTNFNSINFANSDDINPGKKTIAISNSSVQYENKYASGLISGINRTFNISGKVLSFSDKLEGVFECNYLKDNSFIGGPVITYNGELAGIVGSVTFDNKDIFYVIPSNQVKKSINLAISGELKKRPKLGLYYLTLSRELAIISKIERDKGALLYSPSGNQGLIFISGLAAENSGLKIGDIIIAVNDKEINLSSPLSNLVNDYKAGDKIEFIVLRAGQEIKIPVQL